MKLWTVSFHCFVKLFLEICDFGLPQTTETDSINLSDSIRNDPSLEKAKQVAIQATGSVSWRRADIKYRSNEAFVDVIECVNLLVSSQGSILRSDVSGSVMMRAYLSGMPECKFGLNDRQLMESDKGTASKNSSIKSMVELDDCQFHQCVKLANFEETKTIHFIPP
jgi:AP-2 complex subunit mu-1